MNRKGLDTVTENTIIACKAVLQEKGGEYISGGDRLSNFKHAGALNKNTPEKALLGMLSKHIVSIWDLVDRLENGRLMPLDNWDVKLVDAINYFILLRALIIERQETWPFQRTSSANDKRQEK